ncbi:MAG: DUF5011 domain-containing protein [Candidatus Hydrogenedentes bacterium]|nr:DUF5011 domain-containing protein [Candidatus Hydrogenedentota bacterium]
MTSLRGDSRQRVAYCVLVSVLALVLTAIVATGKAGAETFIVNLGRTTTNIDFDDEGDDRDAIPGDGIAEITIGSGVTSLRAAIEEANENPGHDTIQFAPGISIISPRRPYPPFTDTDGVTIIANPGQVVIDGDICDDDLKKIVDQMAQEFDNLDTDMSGGLTLAEVQNGFFNGILDFQTPVTDFRFTLDYFDQSAFDRVDIGFGPDNTGAGDGILFGAGPVIPSDTESPDVDRELEEFEASPYVFLAVSPNNTIQGLTITKFGDGAIRLSGVGAANNRIRGCTVRQNTGTGIAVLNGATDNVIGGLNVAARNVIGANGRTDTVTYKVAGRDLMNNYVLFDRVEPISRGFGILLSGTGTSGNRVIGNYVGVAADGVTKEGNAFSGIAIRGGASENFIGDLLENAGNVASGNGFRDFSTGSAIFLDLNVYGAGILVEGEDTDNNRIFGNIVGAGAGGAGAAQNALTGITVVNGPFQTIIGSPDPLGRNIISGNSGDSEFSQPGIDLSSSNNTVVQGNYIGLTKNGDAALGNSSAGILITTSCNNTQVGGSAPGEGNVISGNGFRGLLIQSNFLRTVGHVVEGNYIGTNASGTARIPNQNSGLYVGGAVEEVRIGGTEPGAGNLISGNNIDGLILDEADFIQVIGNRIGTNLAGTAALPNTRHGILMDRGAVSNDIGGSGAASANVISGNQGDGVRIAKGESQFNTVSGNFIGVGLNGTTPIPNAGTGVNIREGSRSNTVGGDSVSTGNIIANNGGDGVIINGTLSVFNEISHNLIYRNGGDGIVHLFNGNGNMAAPAIVTVSPLSGTALPNANVEIFADDEDEGRIFLGATQANGSGAWSSNASLQGLNNINLTAIAINAAGNTSTFSVPVPVIAPAIATEPTSLIVVEGDPAQFSTTATGSEILTYRWQFAANGVSFANVANGNAPQLSIAAAQLDDSGFYRCIVSNTLGSDTTALVRLTVIAANTMEVGVNTLTDIVDGNTSDLAHLLANPGPDGFRSLRESIIAANNHAGADTISFLAEGTIVLGSALPALTDPTGGTAINGDGMITLDGSDLSGSLAGLRIVSADNRISGLTLIHFPADGISILGASASNNIIEGCNIGNDGVQSFPNDGNGVLIGAGADANLVGGSNAEARNILSGNMVTGVTIQDAGTQNNVVAGNFIGLNAAGVNALGNGSYGVLLSNGATLTTIGGASAAEGNVIAGNQRNGIFVIDAGTDNSVIRFNTVGASQFGVAVANRGDGIQVLTTPRNTLIQQNTILGNTNAGVRIQGAGATGHQITRNAITRNGQAGIVLASGANGGILPPVITGISAAGNEQSIGLTGVAGATIEIFADNDNEGNTFIAETVLDGAGEATLQLNLNPYAGMRLTATATNAQNNTSAFSLPVIVDLAQPEITLLGSSDISIQCGAGAYTEPGVTAIDDVDGDISSRVQRQILLDGAPQTAIANSPAGLVYELIYTVSDTLGRPADPVTRIVRVIDTVAPVISLLGDSTVIVQCGTVFTDPGAVLADSCDPGAEIVVGGDTVVTSALANFTITYDAVDSNGNAATRRTRTVRVQDAEAPVITLIGPAEMELSCNTPFNDPGASVVDGCDSTPALRTIGTVDISTPGVYNLLYAASDDSGNEAATVGRKVTVTDNLAPTLTLIGGASIVLECGTPYVEQGVLVQDACDSQVEVLTTGSVNAFSPGEYVLTYAAEDSSGNEAAPATRTVTVRDRTAPEITLLGGATLSVACNTDYIDPGAVANDDCEGDLTTEIDTTINVNTEVAGVYTVLYNVSDGEGNDAIQVTRTVTVLECPLPCDVQCAVAPLTDLDGDGLIACVEECLGTDDANPDSDGDGMADGYEVAYNLDPLADDALLDEDEDQARNRDEFVAISDPFDASDPETTFYVSPDGVDVAGGGAMAAPWRTIGFAMAQVSPTAAARVRIVLAEGVYGEDIDLLPHLSLVGVLGGDVQIDGTLLGAEGAYLANMQLNAFNDEVLLTLDNVAMSVYNVIFAGTEARPGTGLMALGSRTAGALLDSCTFQDLSIGIDILGAVPQIRNCTFENTSIAAIFLRASATVGNALGSASNAATGANRFRIADGKTVINSTDDTLVMERNEWDTAQASAIAAQITGPVDFQPFLTPAGAAAGGAATVVVMSNEDQSRVGNATVTFIDGAALRGAGAGGIYSLYQVPPGIYTVEVAAPGFETQQLTVEVEEQDDLLITVILAALEGKSGNSCHGGATDASSTRADLLLMLFVAGALVLARRKIRARP